MADKQLFDGHKYTFNKVSGSLVLLDSTDNSHETITFREGMIVSASTNNNPIEIKTPSYDEGLVMYEYGSNGDEVARLSARNDDGYFHLKRGGTAAFYVNASSGNSEFLYMKSDLATNSAGRLIKCLDSANESIFEVRANKNVFIGTSTSNPAELGINYNSPSSPLHLRSALSNYAYQSQFDNRNSNTAVKCLAVKQNGTDKFFVYTNGSINAAYTTIFNVSDSRLKENVVDANSQWDDIKAIEWKNFKMLKDSYEGAPEEKTQLGVIAQQVETVSPTLVEEHPPTAEQIKQNPIFGTLYTAEDQEVIDGEKKVDDVKEVHHNVKNMNYSILWMKSCKALQEAMIKIEQLEARVTELENN